MGGRARALPLILSVKMKIHIEIDEIPPTVNHYWGKRGKAWYTLKKVQMFKERLAWIVLSKKENRKIISTIWNRDIEMDIEVYIHDRRRRDIDNMLKGIMDALKGVVYSDDSLVSSVRISKKMAEKPKTIIVVRVREKQRSDT